MCAVAHLRGKAEDEGGQQGQLHGRRLRLAAADQAGGASEQQRERGQQGGGAQVDQLPDIDAGDCGDDVAGGEREHEAGKRQPGPLRSFRQHGGDELGLVAPAGQQGGDEAGDQGFHVSD